MHIVCSALQRRYTKDTLDAGLQQVAFPVRVQTVVKIPQELAIEQKEFGDLRMEQPADLRVDHRLLNDHRVDSKICIDVWHVSFEPSRSYELIARAICDPGNRDFHRRLSVGDCGAVQIRLEANCGLAR